MGKFSIIHYNWWLPEGTIQSPGFSHGNHLFDQGGAHRPGGCRVGGLPDDHHGGTGPWGDRVYLGKMVEKLGRTGENPGKNYGEHQPCEWDIVG